jgi:hypothetical protein
MAKILLGPTVIGIRGTVAGITFSANGSGPYARGWHTPPKPKSSAQQSTHSTLAYWAVLWRSLTAVQQATWTAYAALPAQQLTDSLGQPYYANGLNWYITTNINLAIIGAAAATVAPVGVRIAADTVTAFLWTQASTSTPRWTFAVGAPGLALYHKMFINIVNSIGQQIAPDTYYYMGAAIPNAGRQIHCHDAAVTKFGTYAIGQKVFGYVQTIGADGQQSTRSFNSVNGT